MLFPGSKGFIVLPLTLEKGSKFLPQQVLYYFDPTSSLNGLIFTVLSVLSALSLVFCIVKLLCLSPKSTSSVRPALTTQLKIATSFNFSILYSLPHTF